MDATSSALRDARFIATGPRRNAQRAASRRGRSADRGVAGRRELRAIWCFNGPGELFRAALSEPLYPSRCICAALRSDIHPEVQPTVGNADDVARYAQVD